ncbi:methyltransferase domain-containing protein [Colletotrichum lupini]|uniref:Methyltransferase domain-containing protein n=1 Tax=Colletotrichum lupini TaxID=145971 RepID=A0A9Q8SQ96_9PEZI|nr:methyltransferase domain-containing protein [Colletotrichum lupini]UQC81420.1 methyltransferase domain-containing protein [Colletotrichum lupini]
MSGSISEVEAQPVQPTAASTADAPSTSADIEVNNEVIVIRNDASTMDDRMSSYTASLSSSMVDYPTEYGRTYHAFRAGSYNSPNDEAPGPVVGCFYVTPMLVNETDNVIVGATEMGDFFPNAEVTGIDLSPIQPSWVPPNVKFEVDDVESP